MSLHPDLIRFQRRLEDAGVVAAVHSDHLCVRLPLLASVRVRYDGTRLAFDPRFGAVSRTMATASTFFAASVGVAAMLLSGVALPIVVGTGVLGVLGSVYDVMRYIVTEAAVTRVTLLWTACPTAETVAALGSGPARTVHTDAAGETVRTPLHVE